MTKYLECADEIIAAMISSLQKQGRLIGWDNFKDAVDNATSCSDLQRPYGWVYETGKCIMFQAQAEKYLNDKRKLLCK